MTDDLPQAALAAFSADYFEAREKFRRWAPSAVAYPSAAKGPGGEALSTDVAWFGDPAAPKVFVTVSSTHGVEGYCGSACQVDWLAGGGPGRLAADEAALVIHAINPYGFAWDRRVTEEGCDLNRNFVDFAAGVPENAGYDELAVHIVPPALDGPVFAAAEAAVADYRRRHGEKAFQIARKSGQYRHPAGVFFGGFAPSGPRRTLERIVGDYRLADRARVVVVDFHTGLGPFGYGEIQTEQVAGLDCYHRARTMFGRSVTSSELGTSTSVVLNGTMDGYWYQLLGDRQTYVCLEYGTFDPESGRRVMRQDHWLRAHGGPSPDPALAARFRAEMRAHFFPDSDDWKEMVVARARQVQRQAVEGLRG
ncbi:uncharacterized protein DUF2817 [Stella humosa]|uniref:Uncharacterized protein DUF2817 n=1 Tax=Stella humosa TaxID=94 RepID=A0A3N1KWD5_9PROT|nr:DUF2817 domain-containing protein [Stella humosa]ROP83129.1 uncharacterized protein DUF2817 [Stella humosa]BBK30094.1 hypothetical protein STHU_07280 [Stella humosa]